MGDRVQQQRARRPGVPGGGGVRVRHHVELHRRADAWLRPAPRAAGHDLYPRRGPLPHRLPPHGALGDGRPDGPAAPCRTAVTYGQGDAAHDEMGYILGNEPCIFGREEDGFEAPRVLRADTKLMSIKVQNNTVARYGDMALWEIRAAYVERSRVQGRLFV